MRWVCEAPTSKRPRPGRLVNSVEKEGISSLPAGRFGSLSCSDVFDWGFFVDILLPDFIITG